MLHKNTSLPEKQRFLIFIILGCVTFCIFAPKLFREGLFFDGLTYSAISMNFAEWHESWWDLKYTSTLFESFYEHPPFHFWLQAQFFKLIPPYFSWSEKLFSFSSFTISSFLIVAFCKMRLPSNEQSIASRTLLIGGLCWLSTGMTEFVFSYNMLDGTLCALTTLSAFLYTYSFLQTEHSSPRRILTFILASMAASCAFLTKGPVGLFPIATPCLARFFLGQLSDSHGSFLKRFAAGITESLVATALTGLGVFIVAYGLPGGVEFMGQYFSQQVLAALSGQRSTVGSAPRLWVLLKTLLTMNAFGLAYLFFRWKRPWLSTPERQSWCLFFLSLAFAASLPIGLSHKIYRFYFMPAMVFYALAFAHFGLHAKVSPLEKILLRPRISQAITGLFAFAAVVIGIYTAVYHSKPHRDTKTISLVRQLNAYTDGQTLNYCGNPQKYGLFAYAYRYSKTSLQPDAEQWLPRRMTLMGPSCPPQKAREISKLKQILDEGGYRLFSAWPATTSSMDTLKESKVLRDLEAQKMLGANHGTH